MIEWNETKVTVQLTLTEVKFTALRNFLQSQDNTVRVEGFGNRRVFIIPRGKACLQCDFLGDIAGAQVELSIDWETEEDFPDRTIPTDKLEEVDYFNREVFFAASRVFQKLIQALDAVN